MLAAAVAFMLVVACTAGVATQMLKAGLSTSNQVTLGMLTLCLIVSGLATDLLIDDPLPAWCLANAWSAGHRKWWWVSVIAICSMKPAPS